MGLHIAVRGLLGSDIPKYCQDLKVEENPNREKRSSVPIRRMWPYSMP
jgi:hypothetical protein